MQLSIHDVTKIEIVKSFPGNGNSRTIKISYANPILGDGELELTVYGATEAFDTLPKAEEFWAAPARIIPFPIFDEDRTSEVA